MTQEKVQMLKKYTRNLPDLENAMLAAGDVTLRQTLETIVPRQHGESREAWFFKASTHTGLKRSRVKSLFYNRECRLWGDELARIQRANSARIQSIKDQHASTLALNGEIANDSIADIKQSLLEILERLDKATAIGT